VDAVKSQRVAVCCGVLRCVAVAVWTQVNILKSQFVAVCCSVLRCVVVWCSGGVDAGVTFSKGGVLQCVVVCCGVLRCVAECCGVLRCVAVAVWMQV